MVKQARVLWQDWAPARDEQAGEDGGKAPWWRRPEVAWLAFGLALAAAAAAHPARAGVFSLPRFVEPSSFGIGAEPELTLTSGAGIAANLKYVHGLNELMNAHAVIGAGDGPRRFRIGGGASFDFFPDVDRQPGIGVALLAVYYRFPTSGRLDATAVPYLHKAFKNGNNVFDPFLAIPFGVGFSSGTYKALATVAVGSQFRTTEHVNFTIELGVAVNNTDSYVSGGLTYYP